MLRSSVSRSLGQGRLQQQLSRYVPPNRVLAPQRRHYQPNFIEKVAASFKLPKLKQTAEANPNNEYAVAEYIKLLSGVDPNGARVYIERGWQAGTLPMNENFLRTYLQAVANMGKLDSLHVTGLLNMLNKNGNSSAAPVFSASVASNSAAVGSPGPNGSVSLGSIFGSASTVGAAGGSFGAGNSPNNPLHVTVSEYNWKGQLGKVVGFALCAFITYVLVLSAMDEKAPGATPGGGVGGNPFSRFGMSSAVHQVEKSDKTFEDVVGVDEAKTDLQEIVLYLKDPKRFTRLGGKLPKGVLLTGPPGTGKTLLARAIAGEAGVPFFHASGSEFEEMFVGVGAKRVRELFEVAKNKSPCIIFIDEIDAIGGSRQLKDQSAMKMTLNQLLVEMDGFAQNNGVIVIAATNFPDSLDAALIRPGRFDKRVEVAMPDIGGRKAILSHYGKKIPLDSDVDMEQLARGTPGFSGADLFNLMNTAALKASVENLKAVNMAALEFAKDKILMGAERKSAVISPESMKLTAFHEAGHALVALKTQGADPIHKATIMPRGRALGMVTQLPDGDQTSFSKHQMLARLDVCMGGRVAEELIYGADHVTSGATSDLQQATNLARNMVTKYGLSTKIGSVFFDDKRTVSPEIQRIVDEEVKALLDASYARAKSLLESHRKELEAVALGLIEFESLSGSEIADLVAGQAVNAKKRSQRPSRDMKELVLLKDVAGTGNNAANANTNANSNNTNTSAAPVKSSGGSIFNRNAKPPATTTPSSSSSASGTAVKAESKPATTTDAETNPAAITSDTSATNAASSTGPLRSRGPPRPDGKTSS